VPAYSTTTTAAAADSSAAPDAIISISPVEASSAADPHEVPPTMIGVDHPDAEADRPTATDESATSKEEKSFWDWLKDKFDGVKVWFSGIGGGDVKSNDD
jgi:hypothetical protein